MNDCSETHVRARRVVALVRRSLTAAALVLLVGFGGLSSLGATASVPGPGAAGSSAPAVDRLMEEHRCSVTGFGEATLPTEAILRSADGHTRVVSFDRGWQAFTGAAPGTLVAVCLGATS